MPAGRPLTPTAIKAARGTLRPDRINPLEPKPELGAPVPRALGLAIRREYDRLIEVLAPLRVLTVADGPVVELTAQALAECWALDAVIADKGHVYEQETQPRFKALIGSSSRESVIRPRPEVRLRADAWRRAALGLCQLGLTPVSRGKVQTLGPAPADDPVAGFKRARPGRPPVARIEGHVSS